jgi:hypothetical protein
MRRYLILLLMPAFVACFNSKSKEKQVSAKKEIIETKKKVKELSALPAGEIVLEEKDFGEVIDLKGTSHPVENIFRVRENEMLALDSLLVVKNLGNTNVFSVYSLPDFKQIKIFGKYGAGPGEFQSPHLVKDESKKNICFIYEGTNNHIYALTKDFEIKELPFSFKKGNRRITDKQLYGFSSDEFVYVESIKRGKAVFRTKLKNDSTQVKMLNKLAFSDQYKNWAAYIGNFGANGKKNRLVYAYKYFKRLVFFDTKNNTSKVVSFTSFSETKKGSALAIMAPTTVTHYWGMSSNDKYVYVLYSGRTPIEVHKETSKSSGYIYIEKYDWNGNPISKYKLDHWGYFCVNQKENTIYMTSTTEEHPFVSFQIP